MDGKTIFDHLVNAASALVGGEDPAPRRRAADAISIPKAKQFNGSGSATVPVIPGPSCCLAKRPSVGAGKLPPLRKPGGEQ